MAFSNNFDILRCRLFRLSFHVTGCVCLLFLFISTKTRILKTTEKLCLDFQHKFIQFIHIFMKTIKKQSKKEVMESRSSFCLFFFSFCHSLKEWNLSYSNIT